MIETKKNMVPIEGPKIDYVDLSGNSTRNTDDSDKNILLSQGRPEDLLYGALLAGSYPVVQRIYMSAVLEKIYDLVEEQFKGALVRFVHEESLSQVSPESTKPYLYYMDVRNGTPLDFVDTKLDDGEVKALLTNLEVVLKKTIIKDDGNTTIKNAVRNMAVEAMNGVVDAVNKNDKRDVQELRLYICPELCDGEISLDNGVLRASTNIAMLGVFENVN